MKPLFATLCAPLLLALMACQPPTTEATPTVSKNLVTNGDFSLGKTDWSTYVQNGGVATLGVTNGVATLSGIRAGNGAEPYFDVQLKHSVPGFALVSGKSYTLSYEAWADSPRFLGVSVWENGTNTNGDGSAWGSYCFMYADLTTKPQSFTRTFTMSGNNSAAGLCFACGVYASTVYLTNVSLVQN